MVKKNIIPLSYFPFFPLLYSKFHENSTVIFVILTMTFTMILTSQNGGKETGKI
jgi:integral membrane sensor domain MASE1